MKILLPLLLATTAFAAEKTFDRTLSIGSNPSLAVTTGSGNIHLHPGSDTQVHIAARLKSNNNNSWFGGGGSSVDVEARMSRIAANPPIRQSGAEIVIGNEGNDTLYRNISIDYDITLPRATSLRANTGSGNVDVEDAGTSLKASTGSGNITARGVHGPANLDTGSGDIRLENAEPKADVRAQTGSGSIVLKGVGSSLHAGTGSGDIDVEGGALASDWKLNTGSGNITLHLPSSARFSLDAQTSSGTVHVDQPITMQGAIDKHHVRGTVNGGGPTLRAETGSGDISLR